MSKSLEEAKRLLGNLKAQYPWRFDNVDSREYPGLVVGAIRTKDGRNVLQPHPESNSMVVSFQETIDFIIAAPKLLADLVRELEQQKGAETAEKALEEVERPRRLGTQGR